VELTKELKDEPDRMKRLLRTRNWEVINLKAIYYIITNIEQKDWEAVRNFNNARKIWKYLLNFCYNWRPHAGNYALEPRKAGSRMTTSHSNDNTIVRVL
jgi:hypothetical protein